MIPYWLGLWPHLNLVAALVGGACFTALGLLIVLLWVSGTPDSYAKEQIEGGYIILAIGVACFLFGGAALLLLGLVALVAIVAGLVKSVKVVTGP